MAEPSPAMSPRTSLARYRSTVNRYPFPRFNMTIEQTACSMSVLFDSYTSGQDLDPQANLGVGPQTIYAPTFDHEAKDPVEDGVVITPDTSVVIIEGNYCLLNEQTWRDVAQLVEYRIFVDTDLQEARRRVAKRHVQAGIEATLDAGLRRVDSNDSLNALIIQDQLITPDLVVQSIIKNA